MLSSFLNGATFEIYNQQGVFQYSGAMPALTGNAASYIETPVAEPYYRLRVKSACGYPYQDYAMYGNSGYKFSPNFTFRGCGGTGTDVGFACPRYERASGSAHDLQGNQQGYRCFGR